MHGIYFLGELEPASKCKAYCIVIAGYRFLCELDCTIKMLIIPHLFEATLENNDRGYISCFTVSMNRISFELRKSSGVELVRMTTMKLCSQQFLVFGDIIISCCTVSMNIF